ncbi:Type I restriction-modification system, specificity subunit S [uncultured Candidatus Thioglobus sp.]|nr:Type I restriction-modification system, specificity subunit S [uncultured Candidatus Thioglobus sp.]
MSYKRLGDYIQLVDKRNTDLAVTNLLGINITKNFMPSVANVSGTNLSKYKVIKKGQFATNLMHVNRDEVLPVALYTDEKLALVSPAYKTFEVIDVNELLPEFLMMEFQRPEFDRKAWTYCDSSIRGGLEWDRLCDMRLPIPNIKEQEKYVALYKGLLNNQKVYENSLDDLQLICDTYIEDLIKTDKLSLLKPHISQIDTRNKEEKIKVFQGISNKKHFITPKQIGVNISNAKVVKKGQFAYNRATTRNGEKISIAYRTGETCAVSAAYSVFKIIDETKLLPEFLLLWFTRSEFDRYARFKSEGSAHEFFDWDNMCKVKIPIPDIKIQEAIVTIYHALKTRKKINTQLKDSIKPLCPVLMRGVVEEMEALKKEVVE